MVAVLSQGAQCSFLLFASNLQDPYDYIFIAGVQDVAFMR